MTSSVARKKVGIFPNFGIFRNRSSNTDDAGGARGERRSEDGRGKRVRRRGDGNASVLSYLGNQADEQSDRHFSVVLGLPYIVLLLIYLEYK